MISSCLSFMLAMSMHVGLEGTYNGAHPHIRCTVDNAISGIYYNSEQRASAYFGYKFRSIFDTEIELGVSTGYEAATIIPMVRITKNNWFITPAYEVSPNRTNSNMGITIGYEFKK